MVTPDTTLLQAATIERTLIDSAVDHLPSVAFLNTLQGPTNSDDDSLYLYDVPKGHTIERIDTEHLLQNPRRAIGNARADDLASLVAYLGRHHDDNSCVWIDLNPATNHLKLHAVIDDHGPGLPGWRKHAVTYTPRLSVEWATWTKFNGQVMGQADFAKWLDDQLADVATVEGLPSGADMLAMLIDFEAKQDMRVKSSIRLQSGGVQIEYVDTDDAATISRMKVFDRFAIGIPVFWGGDRYRIDARLRYRTGEGKVRFWFELVRADRVLEAAAKDVIAKLHESLATAQISVPVFMGSL